LLAAHGARVYLRRVAIPISWTPNTDAKISRRTINPGASRPDVDVTLTWLHQHCPGLVYRVRWWEGTDGTRGQWKQEDSDGATPLRAVKAFASLIAGTVTPWEVEVTRVGRIHTNTGWDYGRRVWTFGHYQRETDEAKSTRGRA
jgi:hypothetical protein